MSRRPTGSTRPDTLFPSTTLFRSALLVRQLGDGLLALLEFAAERVQRCLLLLVLYLDAGECLGQRGQVERGALAGQLLAATLGFEALAVAVVAAGWLDVSSEERRVGKRCVSKCESGWVPVH